MKYYDEDYLISHKVDVALIGIGTLGRSAVQCYNTAFSVLPYTKELKICDDASIEAYVQAIDAAGAVQYLFVLADPTEDGALQHSVDCARTHKGQNNKDGGIAICVVYSKSDPKALEMLAEFFDVIIIVDKQTKSLADIVDLLLIDMYDGFVGVNFEDVTTALNGCKTMYYFHGEGDTIDDVLGVLKTSIDSRHISYTNSVISIKMKNSYGLEILEQVYDNFKGSSICIIQGNFHKDDKEAFEVSLLVGESSLNYSQDPNTILDLCN